MTIIKGIIQKYRSIGLMSKRKRLAIYISVIFFVLFAILYFGYFFPTQFMYNRIAKLPSHDLTLFRNEYDRVIYQYPYDTYMYFEYDFDKDEVIRDGYSQFLIYDGEIVNDRDALIRVLNNDKLSSWDGKHYFFYDVENNQFGYGFK